MRKKYGRWLLAGLLLLAAAAFGFKAGLLPTEHHLVLHTGAYTAGEEAKSGWRKHFALDTDQGVSLDAQLTFKRDPLAPKERNVQGKIFLHTPTGRFEVRLDPKESLSLVTMPDGRPLYYGMLAGRMTLTNGQEDRVAMMVAFVPDGPEQYMTVATGALGDGAEFVFGKPFFTADLLAYIRGQLH